MMRYKDRDMVEVGELVFEMPTFIHDFGHREHHNVPMANPQMEHTVRNWVQVELHEIVEHYFLYPVRAWLRKRDARAIYKLDILLSFIWGFICGFPTKDVFKYLIWELKGCSAYRVWKRPELLQVLLDRDAEEGRYNRWRLKQTQKYMDEHPIYEGENLTVEQVVHNLAAGIGRQSRLILDNLGVWADMVRGYLIYALENNLDFDLSFVNQHVAFKAQVWRQAKE